MLAVHIKYTTHATQYKQCVCAEAFELSRRLFEHELGYTCLYIFTHSLSHGQITCKFLSL